MMEPKINSVLDLEIRIFPEQDLGYPVYVKLGDGRDFGPGFLSRDILPWSLSGDLAADGQRLFNALFANPKLHQAWNIACGKSEKRRIRLWIDADAPELHTLPWELLRDGDLILAADARTPFSRYMPVAEPWGGPVTAVPIRVLAVVANPADLDMYNVASLDVVQEHTLLQGAFAGLPPDQIQLEFLDAPVTLEHLERKLKSDYHILHFVGHGTFSQRRERAALYFQDDAGNTQVVSDDDFIALLKRQAHRPRLVFLAACQTATQSTHDAFAGLGPKLSLAGIPAVVTMQDTVAVETAQKLTEAFYTELARHQTVDLAINQARSVLLTAERTDANSPVLFMRLPDGKLWKSEEESDSVSETAASVGEKLTQLLNKQLFQRVGREQRMGFLLLLIFVLLLGIGGPFLLYQNLRPASPERMAGDFRIAVAGFEQIGNLEDTTIGQTLAEGIYLRIQETFDELDKQFTVTVWGPEQVQAITGETIDERASSAAQLAHNIGADIVVYGVVDVTGATWQVAPEFYVSAENFYDAEEIIGQYQFGSLLVIQGQGNIADRINISSEYDVRTQVLSYITIGLAHYANRDFEQAQVWFQSAEQVEDWEDPESRKVLYILRGNAAIKSDEFELAEKYYRQALEIDPEYARGYIGVANVYYMKALIPFRETENPRDTNIDFLNLALENYKRALEATYHPPLADTLNKIQFGLGQTYFMLVYSGQTIDFTPAVEAFQTVIATYEDDENPRVRERAAEAHARLGLIYDLSGYTAMAVEEYKAAVELSYDNPDQQGHYAERVEKLQDFVDETP